MNRPSALARSRPPTTNRAMVPPEVLPVVGLVRCFTATTESDSIAATSMERVPVMSGLASVPNTGGSTGVTAGGDIRMVGGGGAGGAAGSTGGAGIGRGGGEGTTGGGGCGDGGAVAWVFSSASSSTSASPTDRTILVSPSRMMSPSCKEALLTFLPLTMVPLVEPRSMMVISFCPTTSMTACMRLTDSSSSIRR